MGGAASPGAAHEPLAAGERGGLPFQAPDAAGWRRGCEGTDAGGQVRDGALLGRHHPHDHGLRRRGHPPPPTPTHGPPEPAATGLCTRTRRGSRPLRPGRACLRQARQPVKRRIALRRRGRLTEAAGPPLRVPASPPSPRASRIPRTRRHRPPAVSAQSRASGRRRGVSAARPLRRSGSRGGGGSRGSRSAI